MDSGPAKLLTLTDGSVTQQQTIIGANFMQQLACSRGGVCYALGSTSLSSGSALFLTISNGVPGKVQTVDGVGFWDSLACNGTGACYAVGGSSGPNSHGVIVPIADGQAGPVVPVPGTLIIWDIDCPTTDTCYAIGSADLGSATLVMPVVNGRPGAVQTMQGGGFSAITCPASNTCYAVGYAGGPACSPVSPVQQALPASPSEKCTVLQGDRLPVRLPEPSCQSPMAWPAASSQSISAPAMPPWAAPPAQAARSATS